MLHASLQILTKRVPLTISRGTKTHASVWWLRWVQEGVEGWGEMVPFAIDERPQTSEMLDAALDAARAWLATANAWERLAVE